MIYLLDTNILIHFIRDDDIAERIERDFAPFSSVNETAVSIVTVGEIRSLAIQRGWGAKRLATLEEMMEDILPIDISAEDILDRYAEIDAFSQNKLPGQPLGPSHRNMGKNDLWIAATASVLGAKLLATDADFDHLASVFLDLEKIVL